VFCSVERCTALTPTGATVELDASLARAPAAVPTFVQVGELGCQRVEARWVDAKSFLG
jgi:hypothetical protein